VPLPPLTENGELPLGVHLGSLREVLDRFGVGSDQRKALALRHARVRRVAQATGHQMRFVIFGSFVTSKSEPNDVDVFLVMADACDASQLRGEARPFSLITVPRKRTSAPACSGSGDWQRGRTSLPR
jgi:hypothetical protein